MTVLPVPNQTRSRNITFPDKTQPGAMNKVLNFAVVVNARSCIDYGTISNFCIGIHYCSLHNQGSIPGLTDVLTIANGEIKHVGFIEKLSSLENFSSRIFASPILIKTSSYCFSESSKHFSSPSTAIFHFFSFRPDRIKSEWLRTQPVLHFRGNFSMPARA